SADTTILYRRDLRGRPRMHHALLVTVEEGQVERLIEQKRAIAELPIGNERIGVMKEVISPGASSHHSATAACAEQTEVGEQTCAAQEASHDDQHDKQRRGTARNTSPLAGARRGW